MMLFRPDRYFVSVLDIDPKELVAHGFEGIILDLDNTVLPRTEHTVPDNLAQWVQSVKDEGIKIVALSNNWHERVVGAAEQLGLSFTGKALKPLPHSFIRARKELQLKRKKVLMIGDQTFTDIIGGHLSGMKAWLVQPLVSQDLKHTKILRHLDTLFLHGLTPEGGEPAFVADEDAPVLL